jgi:glycosyltransferase involved in cell wall biosynthesis
MIHYTYQLCTALANHGVQVTLVTARDYELEDMPHNFDVAKRLHLWSTIDPQTKSPGNPLASAWRKGYRTIRRGMRALRLIYQWILLVNYLVQQRPDLVQFGKIEFPFEAIFLAYLRWRGLRLTEICHEFELRERDEGLLTTWANKLYASIYNNFLTIFLHAENNRERFLTLFKVPPERTHVIPFGNESLFLTSAAKSAPQIDLRQRYGLKADEPVVLFFGTLSPSKGVPDLLRAFALVRQQSRARLLVAGYPTKHISPNDFLSLADELGIADAVIFDLRYIPFEEVGPLMQLAAVAVFPYRNSTQSAALQTAYTFGRPVIATRVGGLPEVVEEGRSGFLVPPQSPAELAEAILKVVNNPQLAAQMGDYAHHLSETRHAWMPIAGQILEVYRSLLPAEVSLAYQPQAQNGGSALDLPASAQPANEAGSAHHFSSKAG